MLRARILIAILTCLSSGLTAVSAQDSETRPPPTPISVPSQETTEKITEVRTPFKLVLHANLPETSSLGRLEKLAVRLGVAIAADESELKATKNATDGATRLIVRMELPSTQSVDAQLAMLRKIADSSALLNGLMHLNIFPVGVDEAQLGHNTVAYARIDAGRDVTHAAVLNLIKTLTDVGIEQVYFEPNPAAPATSTEQPHNVTLLLVEADWSKSPSAKEIETDLQAALKDVTLPEEYRSKLLLAGPSILFAEENIAIYQPKDLGALLAWLDKHKLIKSRIPFGPASISATTISNPNQVDAKPELSLSIESKYVDLPGVLSPPSATPKSEHPFVKSWFGWEWSVKTHSPGNSVSIQYELTQFQQALGQTGHETKQRRNHFQNSFELARDRFAIVHGFAGSKLSQSRFGNSMIRIPVSGLQPLLVIGRTHSPLEDAAALRIPELIFPVTNQGYNSHASQFEQVASPGMPGSGRSRSGSGRAKAAGATTSETQEVSTPVANQAAVTVFYLKYCSVDSVAELLGQLWGKDLNLTVSARTNAIFVRGDKSQIDQIEQLIKVLDIPEPEPKVKMVPIESADRTDPTKPAPKQSTTAPSGSPVGSTGPHSIAVPRLETTSGTNRPAQLRQQYLLSDQKTKQLAHEFRTFQKQFPKDQSGADQAKAKLKQAVAEAFSLRQRLQRAELSEFEDRIQNLRQTIILRERIQETIVDRRVEDLLNVDSQWEPSGQTIKSKPEPGVVPEFSDYGTVSNAPINPFGPTPIAISEDVKNSTTTNSKPGTNRTDSGETQSPYRIAAGGGLVIHTPDEFGRLLEEARKEMSVDVSFITKEKNPQISNEEIERLNQGPLKAIQRKKNRLKLIQDELAAQLDLLVLEVQDAESKLVGCQKDFERMSTLAQKGIVTQSELNQQEQKLQLAKSGLAKAKLLLELYRKIDKSEDDAKPMSSVGPENK